MEISPIEITVLTQSILSSACYELIKEGGKITFTWLKKKFPILSKNEELAEELSDQLKALKGDAQSIRDQINSDQDIATCLSKINQSIQINITQTHTGTGDNIARDKVINYKS